jgi:hypothetical protein
MCRRAPPLNIQQQNMNVLSRLIGAVRRKVQGHTGTGWMPDFNAQSIINSIIFRRVSPISFAEFYITDKDGNDTDYLVKSMLNQNFISIYSQMVAQYLKVGYAVCLIERNVGTSILMPDNIEILLRNRTVVGAKYNQKEYGEEDIVVLYDNYYITNGISREDACRNEKNILGAILSARYSTAKYRGALGILSRITSESVNAARFEDEKKALLSEYQQHYGITEGQSMIIISNQNLKWQSMAMPISTLGLHESREECISAICMTFEIKPELVIGGATYDNSELAELSVLTSLIIPSSKKDMQVFKRQLKLKGTPKLDFTENPIIKNYNAQSDKATMETLTVMYEKGAITLTEYRNNMQKFIDL